MKRTVASSHWYAGASSTFLTLALFITGGCSDSGNAVGDGTNKYALEYGLSKAEHRALKKANKNPNSLKKALLEKKLEKLRADGVVVETTTSSKAAKKPR
jgi:hypothetical protein